MPESSSLASRLAAVNERIVAACQRAARSPDEVTLVAVSKTFPLDDIRAAQSEGLQHFGENKAQELETKATELPGAGAGGAVTWHMIGHLQRNKARLIAEHADVFHGLDSLRLARTLDRKLADADRVLPCFLQVNISDEDSKSGIRPREVHEMLDQLAAFDHLDIVGLMTLASPADDPEAVRHEFARMRSLRDTYDASAHGYDQLPYLSMGMSSDFEVAIEEGATHIRIGSALFGPRDYT